jgi:hypothetical protein
MCLFLGYVSGVNSTAVPCNVNFPGFWPRILMMPGAILNQEGDERETGPSLRLVIQQVVRSFLSETLGLGVKTLERSQSEMTAGGPSSACPRRDPKRPCTQIIRLHTVYVNVVSENGF